MNKAYNFLDRQTNKIISSQENPLISVVVPVYNVERYASRCIGSVLQQTYKNFELILIDDGSPDKSGKICDAYAEKDDRIKVTHKSNGGVSSARNMGIEMAQGEYIIFVDSDDWLPENALDSLIVQIEDRCDLVVGSYQKRDYKISSTILKTKTVFLLQLSADEFLPFYNDGVFYTPWAKLFKREIIHKSNIRFDLDVKQGEDTLFVREYLKYCKIIKTTNEIVYFYNLLNENSASKKFFADYYLWSEKAVKSYSELLEVFITDEKIRNMAVAGWAYRRFVTCVESYVRNSKKEQALVSIQKSFSVHASWMWLDLSWMKSKYGERFCRAAYAKDMLLIWKIQRYCLRKEKVKKLIKNCIKWIRNKIWKSRLEINRDMLYTYQF